MRRVASDQGASYESKVQQQGRDPLLLTRAVPKVHSSAHLVASGVMG